MLITMWSTYLDDAVLVPTRILQRKPYRAVLSTRQPLTLRQWANEDGEVVEAHGHGGAVGRYPLVGGVARAAAARRAGIVDPDGARWGSVTSERNFLAALREGIGAGEGEGGDERCYGVLHLDFLSNFDLITRVFLRVRS